MTFCIRAIICLAAVFVMQSTLADDVNSALPPATKLTYTKVTMDASQHSYFEDGELPFEVKEFAPPSGPIGVSAATATKNLLFTTADKTWATDWHPTPRRQFVVVLAGEITIEVESGEIRRFKSGDVFLLEDTAGRGHDSRVVSDEPAMFAMVALPE
ncbi:MAG: cupin domain-containing protein [Pseudomonadota bacterium]